MIRTKDINGAVLIGGKSSRMGSPKAFLQYQGEALYLRTASLMANWVDKVYISGKQEQTDALQNSDLPFVSDKYDNIGPLAGILSVFEHMKTKEDALMIVATDMPFLNKNTFRTLSESRNPEKMVTLYKNRENGFLEPLCAIYESPAYLRMKKAFMNKQFALHRIFREEEVECIEYSNKSSLDNINFPDQWQNIQ